MATANAMSARAKSMTGALRALREVAKIPVVALR
jgi:hypothetical protein